MVFARFLKIYKHFQNQWKTPLKHKSFQMNFRISKEIQNQYYIFQSRAEGKLEQLPEGFKSNIPSKKAM